MGVTGLWTVLQPCARPIKIETLNKKRLAVDASIWIYQFLKAVRDKEGNALRNSHIVGFFRRICKLLFIGIKPVFVFDGGAPALKRQTIANRKQRREGRREDAVRTAGKLLALQMQRIAEEEEKKRKEARKHPREEPEEEIPENVVYAEEVLQTQQERQQNRKFKKKDAYHLPELDSSLAGMAGQNDPRIMSLEELEEYARQFDTGEDINVYDFSKIDFDSPFFQSLPAADRYNILNAARLRSRLRMGYSKDQLDHMFPDRMAFSKFQIERVRERNELTQRLMHLSGMTDDSGFGANAAARIASEKGREYVLVKNEGVEGGWALGVVTNREEGQMNKPIDVDTLPTGEPVEDEDWESEDEFEDVPIEGLNRLPKPKPGPTAEQLEGRSFISKELAKRRKAVYDSRKKADKPKPQRARPVNEDPDSLFLAAEEDDEDEWENVNTGGTDELFEEDQGEEKLDEEEEHLQKAIALSLQKDAPSPAKDNPDDEEDDPYREVFQQDKAVEQSVPFSSARGSALAIARMANQRSNKVAKRGPFATSESEDDEELEAAMARSRKPKPSAAPERPNPAQPSRSLPVPKPAPAKSTKASGFDGPLPFEKLDLGSSILGRKKVQKAEDVNAGGFVRDGGEEKKKAPTPPPWFAEDRDIQQEIQAQKEVDVRERERERKESEQEFQFQELPTLRKQDTKEVIVLDASQNQGSQKKEVITLDSTDEEDIEMEDVVVADPKLRMGDLADKVRADPPKPLSDGQKSPPRQEIPLPKTPSAHASDDEPIEWSESDYETQGPSKTSPKAQEPQQTTRPSPSASPEFEDVAIDNAAAAPRSHKSPSPAILEGAEELGTAALPLSGTADEHAPLNLPSDDSDQYSDPEDAELFASLAAEASEHARFASSLNNNTTATVNFDEELKQLRAQQKKDRRDADEVTQTMISECQQLLTLFGLPYITAPMEAEAQCAELVRLGLVDGIVTDDSDTFLFGGTRVYKNMFNTAKFVECYLLSDLETEFALSREKLISIAQLLGSDYTPGIPGIGPVTALEILSEFGDLPAFKDWWTAIQSARPGSKPSDEPTPWRRRFRRNQLAKLFLPPGFPDPRVADAYLHPDVDSDNQSFVWGVPDLDALRHYLSKQVGWSMERTDEVLVPVVRDMNRREKEGTQSNITRFFDGGVGAGAFAPRAVEQGKGVGGRKRGSRMGAALGRLREREMGGGGEAGVGGEDGEDADIEVVDSRKGKGKSKAKAKATGTKRKMASKKNDHDTHDEDTHEDGSGNLGTDELDEDDDDVYSEPKPKKSRRGRKGKAR